MIRRAFQSQAALVGVTGIFLALVVAGLVAADSGGREVTMQLAEAETETEVVADAYTDVRARYDEVCRQLPDDPICRRPTPPPADDLTDAIDTGTVTVIHGVDGTDGRDGRDAADPTPAQLAAAVATYCSSGACTGPAGPAGPSGTPGADGASVAPTDEQVAAAVAAYCAEGACTGPAGAPGTPGAPAAPASVVFQRYNGVTYRCERDAAAPALTYDCSAEPNVPADP